MDRLHETVAQISGEILAMTPRHLKKMRIAIEEKSSGIF